jgi:hypothetical protein
VNITLIRRMINLGFTNEDIVQRLRTTNEVIDTLRKLIDIENKPKQYIEKDWEWDE